MLTAVVLKGFKSDGTSRDVDCQTVTDIVKAVTAFTFRIEQCKKRLLEAKQCFAKSLTNFVSM